MFSIISTKLFIFQVTSLTSLSSLGHQVELTSSAIAREAGRVVAAFNISQVIFGFTVDIRYNLSHKMRLSS